VNQLQALATLSSARLRDVAEITSARELSGIVNFILCIAGLEAAVEEAEA